VLVKAYLDGGNQVDSTQYEVATLASLVGRNKEWKPLEREWNASLNSHGIDYLHTTDAVTFNGEFERQKGWDEAKRDAFMNECAQVLCNHVIEFGSSKPVKPGLIPYTVTIVLKDFRQYQTDNPSGPQDATEILATCALWHAFECFKLCEGDFLQMYFDQNEPFYGHVKDRLTNPRFIRDAKAHGLDVGRRLFAAETNMRSVAALQAADLLAYCVANSYNVRFSWQQTILDMNRQNEWLDYPKLDIDFEKYDRIVSKYKLPRRRPTR
jgi:hypothetical protein